MKVQHLFDERNAFEAVFYLDCCSYTFYSEEKMILLFWKNWIVSFVMFEDKVKTIRYRLFHSQFDKTVLLEQINLNDID